MTYLEKAATMVNLTFDCPMDERTQKELADTWRCCLMRDFIIENSCPFEWGLDAECDTNLYLDDFAAKDNCTRCWLREWQG